MFLFTTGLAIHKLHIVFNEIKTIPNRLVRSRTKQLEFRILSERIFMNSMTICVLTIYILDDNIKPFQKLWMIFELSDNIWIYEDLLSAL